METAFRGTERPVGMRLINELELFANVVNIKSIPGIKSRYGNIDFTIIREQTEDAFSGLEHEVSQYLQTCVKLTMLYFHQCILF